MSTKVATAILEIRTDTGQVKTDLAAFGTSGKSIESIFKQAGQALTAFGKGFDQATSGVEKFGKSAKKSGDDAAASFESAGVSFGKLVASYISAEAIIGAAKGAWNLFTGAISESIKAAGDAEKAHAQTVAALRAQGTAVPSVVKAYQDYAAALQKTTIYQDDALEGAEALLVTVGNVMPRDMKKALEATTELASGLGKDLNDAAMLVSKAAEGNVTALKKSGIVIDETKAKAQGFGFVLDAITAKFGGQAAALAGTYQGRLQQLANTWNNVEESIGHAITTNATVLELMGRVNGIIDKNTGELKDNATAANVVSSVVIGAVRGFALLGQVLDVVNMIRAGVVIGLREIAVALGDIGIFAARAGQAVLLAAGNIQGAAIAGNAAKALIGAVQELRDRNAATVQGTIDFGNALDDFSRKADKLAADLEKTRGKTIAQTDATDTATNAWNRHTTATYAATEAEKAFAKALEDVTRNAAPWYEVLQTIDGAVVEGATYYLSLGRSVEQVGLIYGLTKGQIEAIDDALKFDQAMVDATGKSYAQLTDHLKLLEQQARTSSNAGFVTNLDGLIKAQKSLSTALDQATLDSFTLRKTQIADAAAQDLAALNKTGAGYNDAVAAILATENAAMNQVDRDYGAFLRKAADEAGSLAKTLLARFAGIPNVIQQALTGGGGFGGAAKSIFSGFGADIGTDAFGKLAGRLSNTFSSTFGTKVTEALGTIIPGIGGLIGSLAGPLIQKLMNIGGPSKAEVEGRKIVDDFEKRFANTTDMINQIGEAYRANGKSAADAQAAIQRLWAAEKQGADATKAALEEINELLKRQGEISDAIHDQGFQSQDEIMHAADIANAAYERMRDSGKFTAAQVDQAYRHYQELLAQLEGAAGEAARAWLKAHQAADGAVDASSDAMKSAEADLKGLIDKRDQLTKDISAEAPEAVEGIIQQQQEAQRDSLDQQIQRQADAYAQLAKDTGQEMADSIKDALERLHINIDIGYTLPPFDPSKVGYDPNRNSGNGGPGGDGTTHEAAGDWLRVTRPRTFMVGEAGPEDVAFGGAGRDLAMDVARALGPAMGGSGNVAESIDRLADVLLSRPLVVNTQMDGRTVIRSTHKLYDQNLDGVRTELQELAGTR